MFRVLHFSHDIALTERLMLALEDGTSVVRADPTEETLRDLSATVRPDLIVVDFATGPAAFATAMAILQALHEADPSRPVVAIGDDTSSTAVLAAVRAGARDFLGHTAPAETLRRQITSQLDRLARGAARPAGRLVVVTAGQSNDGEGLFAVNYAVLAARKDQDVLLLDCHLPSTLAGPALDLGMNYTLRDAVHDLPRLDRTLLATVLARHRASGLYVLPLALGAQDATDVTGSAIIALLDALRGLFSCIVVNLAGLQHGELVAGLLAEAEQFYLVATQRFTSVKGCRDLLARLSATPEAEARVTLVVPDYDPAITLSEAQMRTTLGLTHGVRLPRVRAGLLNAANKGVPFVIEQPTSAYTKTLARLAGAPAHRPHRLPRLRRLLSRRHRRSTPTRAAQVVL